VILEKSWRGLSSRKREVKIFLIVGDHKKLQLFTGKRFHASGTLGTVGKGGKRVTGKNSKGNS